MRTGLDNRTVLGLAALSGVVVISCLLLFVHVVYYPSCSVCDAVGYGVDAARIQQNGLAVPMASKGLRTYAYPSFLAIAFAGYQWDATWGIFSPRAAIVQTLLYLAACLTLFFSLLPVNRTFAWCAAIGLMCNPFVLNYVPQRLTEGLTASLAIFTAACAVWLSRPSPMQRKAMFLFVGSLVAGFAMMVRPANLSLCVAWMAVILFLAWRHKGYRLAVLGIGGIGMALPILPQIGINYFVYHEFGFFPTRDLGELQTKLGLANFKYATVVLPDRSAVPVFYRSSLFSASEIADHGPWLYLLAPLRGAALAASHVFQSINHDYFFPYIYDRNSLVHAPINLLGHTVIFLAGLAGWRLAVAPSARTPVNPAVIFVVAAVAMTLLVNSVAVVETRFGMLAYVAAGPLAVWSVATLRPSPNAGRIAAAALLYGVCASALSFAMLPAS